MKDWESNLIARSVGRNITNQKYATQYIVSEKGSSKAEGYYYDPGSIFGVELSTKF